MVLRLLSSQYADGENEGVEELQVPSLSDDPDDVDEPEYEGEEKEEDVELDDDDVGMEMDEDDGDDTEMDGNDEDDVEMDGDDEEDEEDACMDAEEEMGEVDGGQFPVLLTVTQVKSAQSLREKLESPHSTKSEVAMAYHNLIVSIFTTQSAEATTNRLHSLTDTFAISTSISMHGTFLHAHELSSGCSKMLYIALYSILHEVTARSSQPFTDGSNLELSVLFAQSGVTAGCLNFTFDGHSLSVTLFTNMYHDVYEDLSSTLQNELLLGMSEDDLGALKLSREIVDNPKEHRAGQGFLVSEMQNAWCLVRLILQSPELCNEFFSFDDNGQPVPRRSRWQRYLHNVEKFKEGLYFLLHQIPGMPKRGTEEIRTKMVDTQFRSRSLFYMFDRLACIGFYTKTGHNTGRDKTSLTFLARSLEHQLQRYYASVATIEAWATDFLVPNPDPERHCYLLSSMGECWKPSRLTRVIQGITKEHLGVTLNRNQLRHILPGIADHYNIAASCHGPSEMDYVMHSQMGHTTDTGNQLYSRKWDDHPELTSRFSHAAFMFCEEWQRLWGFDDAQPNRAAALARQAQYAESRGRPPFQQTSVQPCLAKAELDEVKLQLRSIQKILKGIQDCLVKGNPSQILTQIFQPYHPPPQSKPPSFRPNSVRSSSPHTPPSLQTPTALLSVHEVPTPVVEDNEASNRNHHPEMSRDESDVDDQVSLNLAHPTLILTHDVENDARRKRLKINADTGILMGGSQVTPKDSNMVYCPQCDVHIDQITMADHIRTMKREGDDWHIFSFSYRPVWRKKPFRFYREVDLRILCTLRMKDQSRSGVEYDKVVDNMDKISQTTRVVE
ncbi:hypothetical protein EV363DRAFT_1184616 [Boletus edulis]|nr:hypothetical protein EV363DRAFT_1184616 [Boletus edulis]